MDDSIMQINFDGTILISLTVGAEAKYLKLYPEWQEWMTVNSLIITHHQAGAGQLSKQTKV